MRSGGKARIKRIHERTQTRHKASTLQESAVTCTSRWYDICAHTTCFLRNFRTLEHKRVVVRIACAGVFTSRSLVAGPTAGSSTAYAGSASIMNIRGRKHAVDKNKDMLERTASNQCHLTSRISLDYLLLLEKNAQYFQNPTTPQTFNPRPLPSSIGETYDMPNFLLLLYSTDRRHALNLATTKGVGRVHINLGHFVNLIQHVRLLLQYKSEKAFVSDRGYNR